MRLIRQTKCEECQHKSVCIYQQIDSSCIEESINEFPEKIFNLPFDIVVSCRHFLGHESEPPTTLNDRTINPLWKN